MLELGHTRFRGMCYMGAVPAYRTLKMPLALAISDSGNNPNLCLAGLWFVCLLLVLTSTTVGGIAHVSRFLGYGERKMRMNLVMSYFSAFYSLEAQMKWNR